MTAITLGTIGFKEVHDLSDPGKIFTVVLIVFGVTFLGYTASKLAQSMFEGQLQRFIGRQKVEKTIESMKNHYIICGYGRIGSLICREFAAENLPFVVIENQQHVVEKLEEDGRPFIRGNATEDEILLKAGIVGIKKKSGKMVFNPESGSLIEANDTLIVLGESSAIGKLETMVSSGAAGPETGRYSMPGAAV